MLNYIEWSSFWKIFVLMLQQIHQRWINVETTLIINFNQRCFNINIWLKMKVEPTHIYQRCFNVGQTTLKNFDWITSIQRRWATVLSTLKFGWKWKLSRRMFIDVVSTWTKQRWNHIERNHIETTSALLQHWESRIETALSIAVLMFTRKWLKNKTNLSFQV